MSSQVFFGSLNHEHKPNSMAADRHSAEEIENRVRELAEPLARDRGLEIFAVEYRGGGHLLRVFLDRRYGPVTLDDCQAVSERLSALLDEHDFIPQSYRLEVSSPGLDRPLKGQDDYLRFQGEYARLLLLQPASGNMALVGRIGEVQNGMLRLHPQGQDPLWLPLSQIRSARLEPLAERGGQDIKRKKNRN